MSKVIDGIKFVDIAPLIELKFAIADATTTRRELADIQELIRYLRLPRDFANKLAPCRREQFQQLWAYAQVAATDEY